MQRHLGFSFPQSFLTPFLLIILANLIQVEPARKNQTTIKADFTDRFHAFHVDNTTLTSDPIKMEPFIATKQSARSGNPEEPEDDITISDEPEDDDDEEEDESYDEEDLEEDDEGVEEEEEEENFKADVRSLSDLPLSKLLQVRGELQRIEDDDVPEVAETRAIGNSQPSLKATSAALGAAAAAAAAAFNKHYSSATMSQNVPNAIPNVLPNVFSNVHLPPQFPVNSPSEKKKTADSEDSQDVPPRRGGWHFEEEEEEEEHEEEHSWISSWHKGKKKKGDIGSVFQLSVTFLAFLAFGGYLLCLIVQAVKGGGPTGPSGEGYRPPVAPMVLMMPARLGVRRPRPPNPGRRRRRRRRRRRDDSSSVGDDVPWPTWSNAFEAEGSGRLWPNVDLNNLQRILFDISRELAESGPILR